MRDFETHTRSGMQLTAFLGSLNLSLRIRSQELEIFESNGTVLDKTFIKSTGTSRRTQIASYIPDQDNLMADFLRASAFPWSLDAFSLLWGHFQGTPYPPPPLTPGTEGT